MTLLEIVNTDEVGKSIINAVDSREFDIIDGDLVRLFNEEAENSIFTRIYVDEGIPRDSIALGSNLMENLGVIEGDLIEISQNNNIKINYMKDIIVEYNSEDYNYNNLKFDDIFRVNLIDFLGDYFLNKRTELFWPEENAYLSITFKNSKNLTAPFKISPYEDKIQLKIKPKVKKLPFNAILMIDCSGSMKKKDVKYASMDSALENLIKFYDGDNIPNKKLLNFFKSLKPKFVINEEDYKITRLDATFIALLMFFSQKISRGLGEKCSIILYSDRPKTFTYEDSKNIFDPTDFTNINVINSLNSQMRKPEDLSQNQTLFSPAIKELENSISKYSQISSNPILVLFLTDGQPEPKKLDPPETIAENVKTLMETSKNKGKQLVLFTLGIGRKSQVDGSLLENIAKIGRGEYHFTKSFSELTRWFENLANEFSINLRKIE
jgi:hypothetical protein